MSVIVGIIRSSKQLIPFQALFVFNFDMLYTEIPTLQIIVITVYYILSIKFALNKISCIK
jgi:hypothetical protein